MRRPTAGDGGAYLLALVVLLVLTGLGIALSGVAQIERRLGSADRARLQALNAADSGLALATARLLAGEGDRELEIVFGADRSGGVERASRVRVAAPELIAVGVCERCEREAGAPARVSYALAAVGELLVRSSPSAGGAARSVARVSVEARLTLQPWPDPRSPAASRGDGEAGPGCSPEARRRVGAELSRELGPPGCRFGPVALGVRARDVESGSLCTVQVPVCVLVTDWSER